MKHYNIDRLSKKDIFGGKVVAPMKEWLSLHGIKTSAYEYNTDMAIITHYMQSKNYPEGQLYCDEALPIMERYYRSTHTSIKDDDVIVPDQLEDLFTEIFDTPVYKQHQGNNAFTFVDLFAGIGGFRIALEQLGGRCVYASEFDTAAQKSYGMNHGVVPFGDITLPENKDRIPEGVNILCAGFPCQPFSLAGLRKGFGDEKKGTLFYDLQDIIRVKRPRIILLENVPGLLSIHNKDEEGNSLPDKTIDTILHILRDDLQYYVPEPQIINARHFGVPQNRDRVFIVGFLERPDNEYQYPTGEEFKERHFGDIRERRIVESKYYMSERYWNTLLRHKEFQHSQGRGFGYRIIDDDSFGHTLMVGGMGLERNLIVDPANTEVNQIEDHRGELNHDHIRVLTERECARMQGFPDYFEIFVGKSPAYKQFGNSVAIPVVREVARSLLICDNVNVIDVE